MRKVLLACTLLGLLFGCGLDDPSTAPVSKLPLEVGDLEQPGVTYIERNETIEFTEVNSIGDTLIYEAPINLDEASAPDIVFTLMKGSNFQVLLVRGENNVSIPLSSSTFEVIELRKSYPEAIFLLNGVAITGEATPNLKTKVDGFTTYTYDGNQGANLGSFVWTNTVYLPFFSSSIEGWIGIDLATGSGVEITGVTLNNIAFRGR